MTGRSVWTWLLLDADGRAVGPEVAELPESTSRFDAELVLGEAWRGLRAAGVASARLLQDGELVSIVPLSDNEW